MKKEKANIVIILVAAILTGVNLYAFFSIDKRHNLALERAELLRKHHALQADHINLLIEHRNVLRQHNNCLDQL